MGITATYTTPYYSGGAVSGDLLGGYPVALGGHPYLLDLKSGDFVHRTVPSTKEQSDTSPRPGEHSVNPAGLWRRAFTDWSHGAGQTFADREESDPARFRSSKGIDISERWVAKLLPDTSRMWASINTNLELVVVGDRVYFSDGTDLRYTTNLASISLASVQSGETAQPISSITSDGFNLWSALGTNGIHRTTRNGGTIHYSDLQATLVSYVKGRLMASRTNAIYNVTASGAAPTPLYTHPNTDFTWVGFTEGLGVIYAAGYSGDKSIIYRTAVKPDGTALDVPVVAGQLPDGEVIRHVGSYLGYVLLGSDKGVRLATSDEAGNLTIGSLIPTPGAVRCFEGQDSFVYFGWTNYDTTSTGLGRLDLRYFTAPLTPAYVSDLMATGQGNVTSVVTFLNKRVFAVSGLGFYYEANNRVPSGTIDSGLITMGINDEKVALFLDVTHDSPLVGSHRGYLSVDHGAFSLVGVHPAGTEEPFSVGERRGRTFEVRAELLRSSTAATTGPRVTGQTFMVNPVINAGTYIVAPLLLVEREDVNGTPTPRDPAAELAFLSDLHAHRAVTVWQEGAASYPVTVEELLWRPTHLTYDRKAWNGTLRATMKTVVI